MHGVAAPARLQTAEIHEGGGWLGLTKVSQDRSRGSDPGGQSTTAESVERVHRELCLK